MIKPGDRVVVKDGHHDAGLQGTVLFSITPHSRRFKVLVTQNSPKFGERESYLGAVLEYLPDSLRVRERGTEDNFNQEILDEVLFYV